MSAVHYDDVGATAGEFGADAFVVVRTVNALKDRRGNFRNVGKCRMLSVSVHAEPAADVELKLRRRAQHQ